jgi:hypothetical protein
MATTVGKHGAIYALTEALGPTIKVIRLSH